MIRLLTLTTLASLILTAAAQAVDIEAFEFNDADGTTLTNATNTINAANIWFEDPQMAPSDIRGGVYNIVKGSQALESNYLQLGNITSGTRFLVLRAGSWSFQDFDSTRLEEFRIAFLNDDTGNSGSTITAQMSIRRNAAGNVEIAGDSLGTGSTNLPAPAPVATDQTTPFLAVLEINKTSNTYKVYYKDGTNPSQVLGMGAIAPTRGGNSIRLAVNNNFSSGSFDYPFVPPGEKFAIDRIAVTDTNPITDLIALEVDRATGAMTLKNTSGAGLTGLQSYSVTSTVGAFDPTKWKKIAGNYDSTGDGSVDNAPWAVTTSTKTQLAEMFQSGDGGGLTNNQQVGLSVPAGGTWLKSPFEDLHMSLNFASGVTRTVNVNFVGNNGLKWKDGDFNFDNSINGTDWLSFIGNSESNLSGLSRVEAYQRGDLNGDGFNDIADFAAFKVAYTAANGAGSFEEMLASIPEPASFVLFLFGLLALGVFARQRPRRLAVAFAVGNPSLQFPSKSNTMLTRYSRVFGAVIALTTIVLTFPAAQALVLEDFPFSDTGGPALDQAANVAHAGNNWVLSGNSWDTSTVLNGKYNILKSSASLANAHIDIANITTGKVWLVADFSGWNFSATASGTSEEVRFAFLDNDSTPPTGSTITAQMNIVRGSGALALNGTGALGTGATNVSGTFGLPLVRSTPFSMVLELDKILDQYSVYYKDNTSPYALLGTAELGASTLNAGDRDGNSIRFAATGMYNDTSEFVDVDRIYLTDTSPIGAVTPVALSLEAKSNGLLTLNNTTASAITFDSYRIASDSNALNFGGWNSLSDQGTSAVDGTDPGTTAGDGVGETWDEAGGSNDGVLAESFLLGSSTMAPNDSIPLGSGFKVGGTHDLTFQYREVGSGAIVTGNISYVTVAGVPGDYNNNGTVDAADYVLWRDHSGTAFQLQNEVASTTPGQVTAEDYNAWRSRFGNTSGSGSALGESSSVPEPSSLLLILLGLGLAGRKRL
jgi:hypothetical protein